MLHDDKSAFEFLCPLQVRAQRSGAFVLAFAVWLSAACAQLTAVHVHPCTCILAHARPRTPNPACKRPHAQTAASIGAFWASINGTGQMNVTGSTNAMQASECDEHCNWSDQQVRVCVCVSVCVCCVC
jgi:hypothetical protein